MIPEATIVVQFALSVLAQVPVDLLAEAVASPIRKLWRRDEPGPITVRATREGQRAETVLVLRPRTQEEFDSGMRQLPDLIRAVAELQAAQTPVVETPESQSKQPAIE